MNKYVREENSGAEGWKAVLKKTLYNTFLKKEQEIELFWRVAVKVRKKGNL